jgi:uncharacterized protein with von Willebrand factor type A (vWA) domain
LTTVDPVTHPDQGERLAVGFCRLLRGVGLRVPASATISFVEALGRIGIEERSAVYWAGRATLVHRPEDLPSYDQAFVTYWEQAVAGRVTHRGAPPPITLVLDDDSDPGDDSGDDSGDEDAGPEPEGEIQAVRFSPVEVLTEKDLADCSPEELDELGRLMTHLRFTTHRRRSRRQVPVRGRGDRPDVRRTVRRALRHHGEPMERSFTAPATRPRRLVLILDVSGSMEPYARALLRFAHAAVVARSRVEVFGLGTRLTRLTRHLTSRDPDAALAGAFPRVKDWAGGTRLGDGLRRFNDEWGIRGMARGGVVVILSDGWDRGDPARLGAEVERLNRVTHRLVWVNPLKATPGYAPLAAGMAAALPHVDDFVEGHSYSSLDQLATILSGAADR